MAQEAYCPGHGSPGLVRACSPGLPPFGARGARTQDGHVALEATPANSGPGGERGAGRRPACSPCDSSSILSSKALTLGE